MTVEMVDLVQLVSGYISINEIASCITAPQYAIYMLVFRPKTIIKIRTIERKKVFSIGFAVGTNQTFIYLYNTM